MSNLLDKVFYNQNSSISAVPTIAKISLTAPTPVLPERVHSSGPATVVLWNDGTKTVVRCHDDDVFDEREGFLLCCAKKLMGNTGRFNDAMARLGVPQRHRCQDDLASLGRSIGDMAERINAVWGGEGERG